MAGDEWSRDEVEATVADYFDMLHRELAGLAINKAEHNERLRRFLQNRSKGSVEFKHANISAVLTLHGYPYIDGYKPRFNSGAARASGPRVSRRPSRLLRAAHRRAGAQSNGISCR
jgi:hypothetical protein